MPRGRSSLRCRCDRSFEMRSGSASPWGRYGLSFGALAVAAGLSVPQACALSLLMFTGASQFAFVGLIGGGRDRGGGDRAAARRAQRALRAAARAVPAPAPARRAVRDRRERGDGGPRHAGRDPARLLVDRRRRLRVLEPGDAARRAGRRRTVGPARVRPRRRRARRVPRAARAAAARPRAARGRGAGGRGGADLGAARAGRRAGAGRRSGGGRGRDVAAGRDARRGGEGRRGRRGASAAQRGAGAVA